MASGGKGMVTDALGSPAQDVADRCGDDGVAIRSGMISVDVDVLVTNERTGPAEERLNRRGGPRSLM
jgi:hypothetical protein